jgi:hypothetical protein
VNEGNGRQTVDAIVTGHGSGYLQKTLSAHEVGLETRAKRITAPGDTGSVKTGTTEQRVVEKGTEGSAWG